MPIPRNITGKNRHSTTIQQLHDAYDPAERMIKSSLPFHPLGYHTTLVGPMDVHPTVPSVRYVSKLLETGLAADRLRACDILNRLMDLQDTDPDSKTYGLWSWYMEEPLSKMSPPDYNWADFFGREMISIIFDHSDALDAALRARLDQAMLHATTSIRRRNCHVTYTNIMATGTLVTLVASELYNWSDLHDYAMDRLRRFHALVMSTRSFTEYNSPNYSFVTMEAIEDLLRYAKDPEALKLAWDLHEVLWEEISIHFHAPSGQWAGPHSRSYSNLLEVKSREKLQGILRDEPSPELPAYLRPIKPRSPQVAKLIASVDQPRSACKLYVKATPPVIGNTYLHPKFALGSITRGTLWNQSRPMLAYWGTKENPAYLRLRFLHDGYDFTTAQFFSVQQEGRVLAGVNFATDAGDTHPFFDRLKNGLFKASDLRLSFEIGGAGMGAALTLPSGGSPAQIDLGGLSLRIAVPFAQFGSLPVSFGLERGEQFQSIDVVLYDGPQRTFDLTQIAPAAIGLAMELTDANTPWRPVSARHADDQLSLGWDGLSVSIPMTPGPQEEMQKAPLLSPLGRPFGL